MKNAPHLIEHIYNRPWALMPEKLAVVAQVMDRWLREGKVSDADMERFRAATAPTVRKANGVVVLPVYGMISHRANMLSEFSGGTSTQKLTGNFRDAMNDPSVGTVVFDVDSPGGTIDGVPELASEMFAARGKKKTIAVANTLSASAAYWLSAMADEVVVSPSAMVGSIGVYTMHDDVSSMNEKLGVKTTLISAGKYKAETHPYAPLSAEAQEYLQDQVDAAYSMFVSDVAKARGVGKKEVTDGYGQGRVVSAQQAIKVGLADRVATLDHVLSKLGVSNSRKPLNVANEQRRLGLYNLAPIEEEV